MYAERKRERGPQQETDRLTLHKIPFREFWKQRDGRRSSKPREKAVGIFPGKLSGPSCALLRRFAATSKEEFDNSFVMLSCGKFQ
jgi:hypothetical protein